MTYLFAFGMGMTMCGVMTSTRWSDPGMVSAVFGCMLMVVSGL